jgi:ketosteroid isomerase-like protein
MPRGNVELARQILEALTRRDLKRLIEVSHPGVEWHSFFADLGEGGVYRGHDGLRQWLSDLDDALELARVELDDALGVGDVVVPVDRLHYRGRGSGVESELPAGWLFEFREGKVRYWRAFREPEQALKALGRE